MSAAFALAALLGAASLVTSFISGILGMAGGMILMGILLAALPVSAAMTLHGMTQFTSNAGRAWMLRGDIDRPVILGYAGGGLAAAALFALVHFQIGKAGALIAMGLTPFLGLALPPAWRVDVMRRGHSFACGLACVSLSLTAGIAGPILDLFFVRSAMGRRAVVGTRLSKGVLERMSDASFRRWTRATLMGLGVLYGGAGIAMLRG